jgi:hypothetical protein
VVTRFPARVTNRYHNKDCLHLHKRRVNTPRFQAPLSPPSKQRIKPYINQAEFNFTTSSDPLSMYQLRRRLLNDGYGIDKEISSTTTIKEEEEEEEEEEGDIKDYEVNQVIEDDEEFIQSLFGEEVSREDVRSIQHVLSLEKQMKRYRRVIRRQDVVRTMVDTLGGRKIASKVLDQVCLPIDWRIPPRYVHNSMHVYFVIVKLKDSPLSLSLSSFTFFLFSSVYIYGGAACLVFISFLLRMSPVLCHSLKSYGSTIVSLTFLCTGC